MIIVFGMKKGGTGKSYTVYNLAGVLVNQGKSVAVLDTDTNETVYKHHIYRNEYNKEIKQGNKKGEQVPYIKCERTRPDDDPTDLLEHLSELYDYVLVDTGGYENDAFKVAVAQADVVYLPFQPSRADFDELIPTLEVIMKIENDMRKYINKQFTIDARLLLTLVDHNDKDLFKEALDASKDFLTMASMSGAVIPRIKAVKNRGAEGLTLADKDEKGKRHPKRSCYEILLDEIEAKREVRYLREEE